MTELFAHAPARPLLCGHRGHSAGGLENSAAALSQARALGAALCEIDLRLTADDDWVVFHDLVLDHAADGRGPVRAQTRAALERLSHRPRAGDAPAQPILGFEALCAHAAGLGLGLVVELKDAPETDAQWARLFGAIDGAGLTPRVLISSFDHVLLVEAGRRRPDLPRLGIIHERHVDPAAIARAGGLAVYSVDHPHLRAEDAAALHAAGVRVAHFVPRPAHFAAAGAVGESALAALRGLLAGGAVDVFGCDDVAWGRALLDGLPDARAGGRDGG